MQEEQLAVILGKNIAQQRIKLGISQKDFSEKLQITPEAMARMEKGKIAPKMSRLQDIAHHLQCTVPYLFRQEDSIADENAAYIAEVMKTLPSSAQDALVNLIVHAVQVMQNNKNA